MTEYYDLITCSFPKNLKNPKGKASWNSRHTQKKGRATPGYKPCEKSGKVVCGDSVLGLSVLASIVNTLPTTRAPIKDR